MPSFIESHPLIEKISWNVK